MTDRYNSLLKFCFLANSQKMSKGEQRQSCCLGRPFCRCQGEECLPPPRSLTPRVLVPRIWVRPLPPRAASRLSGLVRLLRCSPFRLSSLLAMRRADFGQGLGHRFKMSIPPNTNHQSPKIRSDRQTSRFAATIMGVISPQGGGGTRGVYPRAHLLRSVTPYTGA